MAQAKPFSSMQLRLPADLKVWVKERAAANLRSVNGEVAAILAAAKSSERPIEPR